MSICFKCRYRALTRGFTHREAHHGLSRGLSSTTSAGMPRQSIRSARPRRIDVARDGDDAEKAETRTVSDEPPKRAENARERHMASSKDKYQPSLMIQKIDATRRQHDHRVDPPSKRTEVEADAQLQDHLGHDDRRATRKNIYQFRNHRRAEPGSFDDISVSKAELRRLQYRDRPQDEPFDIMTSDGGLQGLDVNVYATTQAPTREQLRSAELFFSTREPTMLFSTPLFRSLPQSHHPEITVLGRSNVGKSSLLNALFARNGMARTSKKPGKTRLMNAYGVSPRPLSDPPKMGTKGQIMYDSWKRMTKGLMLVDQPGYGTGSQDNWGREILKYIENRKQLRRAFILVDSEHGLKSTDLAIITHLYRNGIPHTVVLSKVDKYLHPGTSHYTGTHLQQAIKKLQGQIATVREQLRKEVWAGREAATDFMCVSSEKSMDGRRGHRRKFGIDELRWAMLCACGLQDGAGAKALKMNDITIID